MSIAISTILTDACSKGVSKIDNVHVDSYCSICVCNSEEGNVELVCKSHDVPCVAASLVSKVLRVIIVEVLSLLMLKLILRLLQIEILLIVWR